jgi:hypothetical protein
LYNQKQPCVGYFIVSLRASPAGDVNQKNISYRAPLSKKRAPTGDANQKKNGTNIHGHALKFALGDICAILGTKWHKYHKIQHPRAAGV